LGISTVAGNVNVDKATKNVLNFLEIYEREDIPVYKGSNKPLNKELINAEYVHGIDGVGNLNLPAPKKGIDKKSYLDALNQAIINNPRELTLITLGPLTNIARFIQKYPNSLENVKELIIMGGAFFGPGNITSQAEFNIYVDAEATDIVIRNPIKKIFFGLDITTKYSFKKDFLDTLENRNANNERFKYIRHVLNFLLELPMEKGSCYLHDPIALLHVLDKNIYDLQEHPISVNLIGRKYGKTYVNMASKNVSLICVDVNIEKAKQHFFKLLS